MFMMIEMSQKWCVCFKYDPYVIILQSSKILNITYNPAALYDDK
jgi:hypothetical protein